ncbi:MAG: hypothetical protein ACW98X_12170 [Promethearchaeota archaeon]|jgi:hypothetical protein
MEFVKEYETPIIIFVIFVIVVFVGVIIYIAQTNRQTIQLNEKVKSDEKYSLESTHSACQKYNNNFSEYNTLIKQNGWPIVMPYDRFVYEQGLKHTPITVIKPHINTSDTWKIEYIKNIYPLNSNPTVNQFDNLEMYFTGILPQQFIEKHAPLTYKALMPGPSCNQLPCDCDKNGIPNAKFDPDPILQNKWPLCNIQGPDGKDCCASEEAYKQCYKDKRVTWSGGDTWTGNNDNIEQAPPKLEQLWKPSLWPNFTIAVNKYPPNLWNNFYGSKGKPDNTFVEILNSGFAPGLITYGVWFYQTVGSGIFLNLNKTIAGLNKFDIIFKLGFSPEMLTEFIMRKPADVGTVLSGYSSLVTDVKDPLKTGLGGLANLDYWKAGQVHTNLNDLLHKRNLSLKDLPTLLKQATYESDYKLNRIINTGALDNLLVYLLLKNGYDTAQMTVQPNLYNGWTTEIIVVGEDRKTAYTDISQLPRDQIKILDPSDTHKKGETCTFKTPYTCLYCDELPISKHGSTNCTKNINDYKNCP